MSTEFIGELLVGAAFFVIAMTIIVGVGWIACEDTGILEDRRRSRAAERDKERKHELTMARLRCGCKDE